MDDPDLTSSERPTSSVDPVDPVATPPVDDTDLPEIDPLDPLGLGLAPLAPDAAEVEPEPVQVAEVAEVAAGPVVSEPESAVSESEPAPEPHPVSEPGAAGPASEPEAEPKLAPDPAVPAHPDDPISAPGSAPGPVSAPRPRTRRARPATSAEPGLALFGGSLLVLLAVAVTVLIGWAALLVVVALGQVLVARGWADYLEVPGARAVALGVLVVALAADIGVVVARVSASAGDRPDDLVQLAPALALLFPVAVLTQLARRGEAAREGALAGLVATATGGALVVGLALWLPLEGSEAGAGWVLIGAGVCAAIAAGVGIADWLQSRGRAPLLLFPLLLTVVAGPLYVAGRITAG